MDFLLDNDCGKVLEYISMKEACQKDDLILSITEMNLIGLHDLKKLQTNKKKIAIQSIEKTDFIRQIIRHNIFLDDKNRLRETDSTGLFRVGFTNHNWIYYYKYIKPKGGSIETMTIGCENGWKDMESLLKQKHISFQTPRKGLFHGVVRNFSFGSEMVYYEMNKKHYPGHQVFHQVYDEVYQDARIFFESDGKIYARFNKPRIRKILLTGEPGSGKTSINMKLGREFGNTHSFIFVNDMQSVKRHLQNIEFYDMPSFIVFEDCEDELRNVDSYTLNFMDGMNQPYVQKGVYVIFTTNHPEIIEDRIIKRPGRIDKIFNVGTLKGEYAFECAKYYFQDYFAVEKSQTDIFQNLTGAQIAEISMSAVAKAIEKNKEIDVEIIKEVSAELIKRLHEVESMAERRSIKGRRGIGFKDGEPF